LKDLAEERRIDDDKKGNVVRIWKSSFDGKERWECERAVKLILGSPDAAKAARVGLSRVVMEDNNGVVFYPKR